MNTVFIDEKYVLDYIKNILEDLKIGQYKVEFAKYHHSTSYKDAPSICENGILTMKDLKRTGIKNYEDDYLKICDDENSHVNGTDSVSLAIVGLKDLYKDEDEYNPFIPNQVDFLVSSDLTTSRNSTHYGNEFLSYESIDVSKLKSVDIRMLKLIDLLEKKHNVTNCSIEKLVNNYNYLREISLSIRNKGLNIPLREMSLDEENVLDIDKMSNTSKLLIKK